MKKTKISTKKILKTVEVPEDLKNQLSNEEQALLKFALAELTLNELALTLKKRNRGIKAELVIRLIQLGQRLSYLSIVNNEIFMDWSKSSKPGYIEGFMDFKNQLKGVIGDGLRQKSGRKTH